MRPFWSGVLGWCLLVGIMVGGGIFLSSLFLSCDSTKNECAPMCENRQCGDDGCGGVCGTCLGVQNCDPQSGVCTNPDCGNGVVDPGETCDPQSSCPTTCENHDSCTLTRMLGSGQNCDAACWSLKIEKCISDDGCCPVGCNHTSDGDCPSTCGNNQLDSGETCDPPASCPASCEDNDPCTRNEMSGSAATCNASCSYPKIDQCLAGDGCCPAGCNHDTDSDCQSVTTGIKSAGWRSSEYGHQYDKTTSYWVATAKSIAAKFPGATPAGVYVIGEIDGNPGSATDTYLSFPKPAGTFANVRFDTEDKNASYLDAFDSGGLKIWLQVEPADADVEQLIDLVLDQYGSHSCVKGFGVDTEWLNQKDYPDGRPVTDAEVTSWIAKVKSHNANYKLFLKHWDYSHLPPNARPADVVYITDSEQIGSFNSAMTEYSDWADHFSGSQVAYQVGYPSDKSWWSTYPDPIKKMGDEIVSRNPTANIEGLYWVDFSITDLFP